MGRLFGVNATFPWFSANGDASCQRVSPVPAFRWRLIVSRTDRGVAPLAMPSRASRLRPTWHLSCGRRFFALAFSDLGIADSGRLLVWLCSTFAVITGASALSASLASIDSSVRYTCSFMFRLFEVVNHSCMHANRTRWFVIIGRKH